MPQPVELLPPLGSEVPLAEEVAFLDLSELSKWTTFQGPPVRLPTLVEQLTIRPSGCDSVQQVVFLGLDSQLGLHEFLFFSGKGKSVNGTSVQKTHANLSSLTTSASEGMLSPNPGA